MLKNAFNSWAGMVLIESDWNLKILIAKKSTAILLSINRIRLEFKVNSGATSGAPSCVLIESDWNLKTATGHFLNTERSVLIESDWNLKFYHTGCLKITLQVLIESDWNLKLTFAEKVQAESMKY